jgi:hypothetical protein
MCAVPFEQLGVGVGERIDRGDPGQALVDAPRQQRNRPRAKLQDRRRTSVVRERLEVGKEGPREGRLP